jgi:hypothetical protein
MDSARYYDPPSPGSSSDSEMSDAPPPHSMISNSGNKLHYSARFIRKGKIYAWSPAFEDGKLEKHARQRMKRTLEAVFPEAASELGTVPPPNIVEAESKREAKRAKKQSDALYRLPHLRSPSPPTATAKLAPRLALPTTYTEVMMNNAMRHTLADDKNDRMLHHSASELMDSEKGLRQALGRLREVLRVRERDVVFGTKKAEGSESDKEKKHDGPETGIKTETDKPKSEMLRNTALTRDGFIPALPRIADTDNLWRVTQELIASTYPHPRVAFTITEPDTIAPPAPTRAIFPPSTDPPEPEVKQVVTPVQRLFTAQPGITLSAEHNPTNPALAHPRDHPDYPVTTRYNIDMPAQTKAVDDALERIMELLVDCNEYKERLEESRDRVADIARVRKKVWNTIKQRTAGELDLGR